MGNIPIQTTKLIEQYTQKEGEEIIPWAQINDDFGFTILRDYPSDIPFKPAITGEGKKDSKCMIKIGFSLKHLHAGNEATLLLSVYKTSKYLLNNHWNYNFKDPESPTEESLEESKRSKQPIDLENYTDYVYLISENKILNIKKNRKEVSLSETVETIYNSHLKTIMLSGWWFRIKLGFKDISTAPVDSVKDFLFKVLSIFFGKTIQSDKKNGFGDGVFKTYNHSDLYTLADEQIDPFNSGIRISKKPALLLAFIIVCSSLFFTYFIKPIWWNELKDQSQIVQVSFLLVLIFFVDYIIPHVTLFFINLLVRFRKKMWDWKIRID